MRGPPARYSHFYPCFNTLLTTLRLRLKLLLVEERQRSSGPAERLYISLKLKATSARGGLVSQRGEERRRWEMATQVETLLPGNPLAKAEEHGKVVRREHSEDEGSADVGAKQQTGVADQGSSSSGGGNSGQGGTSAPENQTSQRATEEQKGGCDSDEKQNDDGVKNGSKKEFTEAPPPKVNPWTRKMNAVTVVSVNGQAHHGSYPLRVILPTVTVVGVRPFMCTHPHGTAE